MARRTYTPTFMDDAVLMVRDRHDLLLAMRPDTGDGVLSEPPLNLTQGVMLRLVEGFGDFRVECCGNGERLRGVHDHLREPG